MRDGRETKINFKQNPYVFIVGCARSGTTLLERMVKAHSCVALVPESHWILRGFDEGKGLTPDGFVIPDLIPRLIEVCRFRRLANCFAKAGISREQLIELGQSSKPVPYSTFVTGIFNLFGSVKGKPLVGQKTPGFGMRIHELHHLFPTARFINLIRDGRSVCLSAINWQRRQASFARHFPTWTEDPVSTAALWWERKVRVAREWGRLLGPNLYYEIRYESLVNNPAEECEALCSFLDVPYEDAMLRFHEGRVKNKPGLDAKHAWLPVTPGLRDWRRQMSTQDLERFEAQVGDLLDELGYPRAVRSLTPAALGHAARIRQLLVKGTRSANAEEKGNPYSLDEH